MRRELKIGSNAAAAFRLGSAAANRLILLAFVEGAGAVCGGDASLVHSVATSASAVA